MIAELLSGFGLVTYLLPFILTFTILYGLLDRAELFGDVSRRVNILLSVFISIAAVTILAAQSFFILWTGVLALMAIGALFLFALMKIGGGHEHSRAGKFAFGALILLVAVYVLRSAGISVPEQIINGVLVILAVGTAAAGLLWYILKDEKPEKPKKPQ